MRSRLPVASLKIKFLQNLKSSHTNFVSLSGGKLPPAVEKLRFLSSRLASLITIRLVLPIFILGWTADIENETSREYMKNR